MSQETRLCVDCKVAKSFPGEFYVKDKKDGVARYATRCKMCHGKKVKTWRSENEHYASAYASEYKYGLSLGTQRYLLELQDDICAICTRGLRLGRSGSTEGVAFLDHDHETNALRGFLCHHCNAGIGHFKDSPPLLRLAASYLEESPFGELFSVKKQKRSRPTTKGRELHMAAIGSKVLSPREELLRKIADSDPAGGGNKIRDGAGRLAVKKLSLETKFKGNVFIAEFVVVSSRKIPVVSLQTKGDVKEGQALDLEPNPVGSECSWVQNFTKHETAFGAVKGLILNLYGELDASNDEVLEAIDAATAEGHNPARGLLVDFSTYRKISAANKIEMTIPVWTPVANAVEQAPAVCAWLDSLALQQQAATQPPPYTDADAPRH